MTEALRGGGAGRLTILEADDSHAEPIAEFIRQVWSPSATAESVLAGRRESAALNEVDHGSPPPTWVALKSGRVIGYVTTIPIRLWDGHKAWPAHWLKGLMVLPEFRNGPVGYAVMRAAADGLLRSAGLAVAEPARRLFGALGYTDLGAIPNLVRPVATGRVLRRLDVRALGTSVVPGWIRAAVPFAQQSGLASLFGMLVGAAMTAAAGALRWPARHLEGRPIAPENAINLLDELWARTRLGFPGGVVRDAAYLSPRYPAREYIWLAVGGPTRLEGVAILRRPRPDGDPRLRGIRVAALVDVIYPPDERAVGLALLGAVEREARRTGADAVLATASAPVLQRLLRRQCYLPIGGNVHLLFRDATGDNAGFGPALTDWWLTRGDGQADEVF